MVALSRWLQMGASDFQCNVAMCVSIAHGKLMQNVCRTHGAAGRSFRGAESQGQRKFGACERRRM